MIKEHKKRGQTFLFSFVKEILKILGKENVLKFCIEKKLPVFKIVNIFYLSDFCNSLAEKNCL